MPAAKNGKKKGSGGKKGSEAASGSPAARATPTANTTFLAAITTRTADLAPLQQQAADSREALLRESASLLPELRGLLKSGREVIDKAAALLAAAGPSSTKNASRVAVGATVVDVPKVAQAAVTAAQQGALERAETALRAKEPSSTAFSPDPTLGAALASPAASSVAAATLSEFVQISQQSIACLETLLGKKAAAAAGASPPIELTAALAAAAKTEVDATLLQQFVESNSAQARTLKTKNCVCHAQAHLCHTRKPTCCHAQAPFVSLTPQTHSSSTRTHVGHTQKKQQLFSPTKTSSPTARHVSLSTSLSLYIYVYIYIYTPTQTHRSPTRDTPISAHTYHHVSTIYISPTCSCPFYSSVFLSF